MLEPKHHSSPNFETGRRCPYPQSWVQTRRLCVIIVDAVKLKTLMSLLVEARRPLSTSE